MWIGDDGLVRNVTVDDTVTVSARRPAVKLQLDLSDYGTVANVTAPPTDTSDVSGLIANLITASSRCWEVISTMPSRRLDHPGWTKAR